MFHGFLSELAVLQKFRVRKNQANLASMTETGSNSFLLSIELDAFVYLQSVQFVARANNIHAVESVKLTLFIFTPSHWITEKEPFLNLHILSHTIFHHISSILDNVRQSGEIKKNRKTQTKRLFVPIYLWHGYFHSTQQLLVNVNSPFR